MGNKHIVPYALYVAKAFVSPVFAKRTGFSDQDLELFFKTLEHMFDHDQSAARADMPCVGSTDFEHVGTQAEPNATQNVREASWAALTLGSSSKASTSRLPQKNSLNRSPTTPSRTIRPTRTAATWSFRVKSLTGGSTRGELAIPRCRTGSATCPRCSPTTICSLSAI